MDAADVKRNLSSRLAPEFAEELVETYVKCRRAYRRGLVDRDWVDCLTQAGQFCEAVVAAIHQLVTTTLSDPSGEILDLNQIYFDDVIRRLPQIPNKTPEQESLILLMPKAAQAVYQLRSKKRAAHLKKTRLNFLDAIFTVQTCTWLLGELIRICHSDDEQIIRAHIQTLSEREYPFLDIIEGDIVVLARKLPTLDQILLLLLGAPGNKAEEKVIINSLRHLKQVRQRMHDGDRAGLLYRKEGVVHLTSTGAARIERKLDECST